MATRINVLFPDELLAQVRDLVPQRKRSEFIVAATKEQLKRERQRRALELAAGAWADDSDPLSGTQESVEQFLAELRSADAEREMRLEAARGRGGQ